MNRLFPLIILLSSCGVSSKEDKAKEAIRIYLDKNLNDAKSYEPVEYGKLDSSFTSILLDEKFKNLNYQRERALDRGEHYLKMAKITISGEESEYKKYLDSAKAVQKINDSLSTLLDKYTKDYISSFEGYAMKHKYRAKNKVGATIIETRLFVMDSNFNVIRAHEDSK